MGSLLLRTSAFKSFVRPVPQYQGLSGIGWWIGALITTALGPLLYLWVWSGMFFEGWLTANTLWPQTFTNIYMVWGVFVGVIAWALIAFNHFVFTKRQGKLRAMDCPNPMPALTGMGSARPCSSSWRSWRRSTLVST